MITLICTVYLSMIVTEILQVTVGMPPTNEHTITAPLPEIELRQLIHEAYGDDESTAMLTQVMFHLLKLTYWLLLESKDHNFKLL